MAGGGDSLLLALVWVHILLWIVVCGAGVLHPTVARFLLLYALPLIFLFQSLPLHVIDAAKLAHLRGMRGSARQPFEMHPRERSEGEYVARRMGLTWDEYLDHRGRIHEQEQRTVIGGAFRALQAFLWDRCVFNPISAQGLLIVAFVVNVWALVWVHCVPLRPSK